MGDCYKVIKYICFIKLCSGADKMADPLSVVKVNDVTITNNINDYSVDAITLHNVSVSVR